MHSMIIPLTIILLLAGIYACEEPSPVYVNGSYRAVLAGESREPHSFENAEIDDVKGECKYDEETGMFSFKLADGAYSLPGTNFYIEAVDVTNNKPSIFKIREGELKYEPDTKEFTCNDTKNEQKLSMVYEENPDTGETLYRLKINCSGSVTPQQSNIADPPKLTNLNTPGQGITFTDCDGY